MQTEPERRRSKRLRTFVCTLNPADHYYWGQSYTFFKLICPQIGNFHLFCISSFFLDYQVAYVHSVVNLTEVITMKGKNTFLTFSMIEYR